MADDKQQFQYVKLPDGSYGKFAMGASDDMIRAQIEKDFPNAYKRQQQQPQEQFDASGHRPDGTDRSVPSMADQQKAQEKFTSGLIPQGATISARPEPQGVGQHIERFGEDLSNDLKYGSDNTWIGSVMKKMGAKGLYNGAPEKVGDFMGSLPLGLARATKGGGELTDAAFGNPEHPGDKAWQGTKDVVGGAAQAATIPAAIAAPGMLSGAGAAAPEAATLIDNAGQPIVQAAKAAPSLFSNPVVKHAAVEGLKYLTGAGAGATGAYYALKSLFK